MAELVTKNGIIFLFCTIVNDSSDFKKITPIRIQLKIIDVVSCFENV